MKNLKNIIQGSNIKNLKGVSFGKKTKNNFLTNEDSIIYFVEKKINEKELNSDQVIPKIIEINGINYKTDVVESSFELLDCSYYNLNQKTIEFSDNCALRSNSQIPIDTIDGPRIPDRNCQSATPSQLAHRNKIRPLIGGISIGNATLSGVGAGTSGTLGLLARDKRDGCVVGITNSHVICGDHFLTNEKQNSNNIIKQSITQPAYLECLDCHDEDTIVGFLKRYQPTSSSLDYDNLIDCAIFSVSDGLVNSTSFGQYGISTSEIPWATRAECDSLVSQNISLFKSSRTTGISGTSCVINAVGIYSSVSVRVYGQNKTNDIIYQDLIIFKYQNDNLGVVVGGDSGSVLLGDFEGVKKVVGIVFAGSLDTKYGVAFPITNAAELLDIEPMGQNQIAYSNENLWDYKIINSNEPTVSYQGKKYWQIGSILRNSIPAGVYNNPIKPSNLYSNIPYFLDCNSANFTTPPLEREDITRTNYILGNYVTTVGTNGVCSYYGTYDQSGNVYEWIDSIEDSEDQLGTIAVKQRGGCFDSFYENISKNKYVKANAAAYDYSSDFPGVILIKGGPSVSTGFRLSSINDPLNYSFSINGITNSFLDVLDLNNEPDPDNGLGSVSYSYKIMKYTVTNQEYVEFLNAIDPNGTNEKKTYHVGMSYGVLDLNANSIIYKSFKPGGIDFVSSNSPGNKYKSKKNMANKPVVYVGWYSAARFANWMHNLVDDPNTTETEIGAYNLNLSFYNGSAPTPTSNPNARYKIPTEDEWYKAAYYTPNTEESPSHYWMYATQSNEIPEVIATCGTNYQYYSDECGLGNGLEILAYQRGLVGSGDHGKGVKVNSSSLSSVFYYTPAKIGCTNKNKIMNIYLNDELVLTVVFSDEYLIDNGSQWSKKQFYLSKKIDGIKTLYGGIITNGFVEGNLYFYNWKQNKDLDVDLIEDKNYNRSYIHGDSVYVKSKSEPHFNWGLLRSVVANNIWR